MSDNEQLLNPESEFLHFALADPGISDKGIRVCALSNSLLSVFDDAFIDSFDMDKDFNITLHCRAANEEAKQKLIDFLFADS